MPYFGDNNYKSLNKCNNKLMFIEKSSYNKSADNYIPYLFYRKDKTPNFLIFSWKL